ncbi:MAG: orange carotenoid protein N-terminal domain-containing protein, partial [Leptolyngbyaceae bacterium]|nr:orange carotenoid protein N-terminal domain-containing protein [Leptolyngbyaceae bacterium]
MTYTKTYLTLDEVKKPLELFSSYDVDVQLALLWLAYQDIKDTLNPNPPNKTDDIASAVYNRIEALSQEQQLDEMRNIANHMPSAISKEYAALSPAAKLDTWLKLAQGMENGTIIGYPNSFKLPD